ncbi:MAG: hypothetical protein KAH54_08210 [Candidatus Sabulitectum sp.]|nr:hypothetical protein [Candidatus Sabulitectum sp.]
MTPTTVKTEAFKIVDRLPDTATWQDLMQRIYVRLAIESGLSDSETGKTSHVREIRAKYGLKK